MAYQFNIDAFNAMMGQNGSDRIADTTLHNEASGEGPWAGFVPITEAPVFNVATAVEAGDIPNAADTFTKDVFYSFPLTDIQLTSGVIYAVRK